MNYFELFGLPVSFTVDKKQLNESYVALQKKFHPDFYTQSNEAEQSEAPSRDIGPIKNDILLRELADKT